MNGRAGVKKKIKNKKSMHLGLNLNLNCFRVLFTQSNSALSTIDTQPISVLKQRGVGGEGGNWHLTTASKNEFLQASVWRV